jgi:hypothetical protein
MVAVGLLVAFGTAPSDLSDVRFLEAVEGLILAHIASWSQLRARRCWRKNRTISRLASGPFGSV